MSLTTPTIRASESTHWYTRDGAPQYTVEAKKGGQRNTTLRDARTMNLVPSVTTVLNVAAKPALMAWMQQQVLMAALTLPRRVDEPEKEYIDRIIHDSKEQGRAAADEGTNIHAAIQNYYEGGKITSYEKQVVACQHEITKMFGENEWRAEESFAHEMGFGGKCDLYQKAGFGTVLDVKTKEFWDPSKVIAYEDNLMQLSAYRVGLGVPKARCANVFVSRSVPGMVVIKEWSTEDLDRGWEMFCSLLKFWQLKNKHS
jgi:hypothetical protein